MLPLIITFLLSLCFDCNPVSLMKKSIIILAAILSASLQVHASDKRGGEDQPSSYSIVILGDTHFDAAPDSIYHTGYSDPNPKREANHRKEFARNAAMWKERIPRLLQRASSLITEDTRMVFQTGDLIQGDTGCASDHKKMLADASSIIRQALSTDLPVITVAGNHDLRSADDKVSARAYEEYMCEAMSRELGKTVTRSTFSFNIGPDAFIAINFTYPDDALIERLLEETSGARYTFLLIHSPVFPYDDVKYWNWYLHGRDKDTRARDRLLGLFAGRNVIVLCGHTHMTEFFDWTGMGGRITQMTMNSVWSKEEIGTYSVLREGPQQYGTIRPDTPLFDEFRPGLQRYVLSRAAGSYRLNVSDEGVTVDFYAGDSEQCSNKFVLR